MKYFLIAGEASGDLHASRLMQALALHDGAAQFRFYGGDQMRSAGGTLLRHYRDLAYMGFYQVVTHLPSILGGMRQCRRDILSFSPDVLILVDYPGFNLGIAKWARRHLPGCRIVYYISPKIWAWKSYRIKAIRRDVDLMLSILPFEVEWYASRHYSVEYVGNPTVDELHDLCCQPSEGHDPFILLVPGSRRAEVADNLRVMLDATRGMSWQRADGTSVPYPRIIAGAPGLDSSFYADVLDRIGDTQDVQVRFHQTHQLMLNAHVAAVTSGTATLEAAYLRCPQVVCYNFKGGHLFYNIMKLALRSIRYVSLVNLLLYGITGDRTLPDERHAAVTELLGPYLTAATLRDELQKLLPTDSPHRQAMLLHYERMASVLGQPGAPDRAARAILRLKTQR
ncbi:MAG: lipid-A-disaccharide synthase [Bacteroidales bacterium]|nr:lipid-A-disaccharide synthase [Candidatus Liminaster caballi]